MVIITDKTISLKSNTSYIASILNTSHKKLSGKDILNTSIQLRKYLKCLTDKRIARMLYILSLVRISTTAKLKEYLEVSSRDMIAYYYLDARNAGLMDIKTDNDPDYPILWEFWSGRVRNTHKNTRLYLATDELLRTVPLYDDFMAALIPKELREKLAREGQAFDKYIKYKKTESERKEKERETSALNIIGACSKCDKAITKDELEARLCQRIGNRLYCKDCAAQMYADGTIRRLAKEKNGKK